MPEIHPVNPVHPVKINHQSWVAGSEALRRPGSVDASRGGWPRRSFERLGDAGTRGSLATQFPRANLCQLPSPR